MKTARLSALLPVLRAAAAAALLVLPPLPAAAQDDQEAAAERLDYEVELQGDLDDDLAALLHQASLLESLKRKPPASRAALEKRARADLDRLDTVLRSEGYYDAAVSYRIEGTAPPLRVVLSVDTGVLYLLADFAIHYATARPGAPRPEDLEEIGLYVGMRARAPDIRDAEQRLLRVLADNGFPFAAIKHRKIVVDHDSTTLSVTLEVDSGPAVSFGAVEVSGTETVDPAYVRRLLAWQTGERFDQRKVDTSLARLRATNLFASADIKPKQAPAADGPVGILVRLAERPARTIGGGLSWSTAEGPLGELFWEHRNLFHRNETLRLNTRIGEIEQSAGARLSKPNFVHLDQTGTAELSAKNVETDAYDELSAGLTLGLERRSRKFWRTSVGSAVEYLDTDEDEPIGSRRFLLFSLPVGVTRDSRNDPLDPVRGTRMALSLTPSLGTLDQNIAFLTGEASASAYWAFDDAARFVLAGRFKLGSILAPAAADIPASKRFYAGGGGSVRGYAFQSVGPLDAQDDPVGGRSLIESNLELRIKLTDTIGIVPFLDGGAVYREILPGAGEDFQLAAGLGLRYFTSFVPLRLDIAFPLNPRASDDSFQFYISLGQAF